MSRLIEQDRPRDSVASARRDGHRTLHSGESARWVICRGRRPLRLIGDFFNISLRHPHGRSQAALPAGMPCYRQPGASRKARRMKPGHLAPHFC